MNHDRSYASHRRYESGLVATEALPACYADPHSVDAWRHNRMLGLLDPLLRCYPASGWITVGDGRYGSDAHYLHARGHRVVATSLTDDSLLIAKQKGWIDTYRAENAEALSFNTDACDFLLCKEAYHHFPRPALAFYEMLRVCRLAVVLIEPTEGTSRPLDLIRSAAKRFLRGDTQADFEPLGNFVYRVTLREVFKMMAAIGAPALAIKRFNDCWLPRFGRAAVRPVSLGFAVTRLGICLQDAISGLGLMNFGLAAFVLFKAEPPPAVRDGLRRAGFQLINIPRNPFLGSTQSSGSTALK